jgi:Na+/H+-dicarboxylate symporter
MAIGLVAGLALGLAAAGTKSPLWLALSGQWLRPIGMVFLNSLSMVEIPLVVAVTFVARL